MIILGILLPLIGTTLGSSFVFFLRNKIDDRINKLMIGFAIGVMLAASIFSLIIPSIEMSNGSIIPVSVGLLLGFLFLIIINKLTEKNESNLDMLIFSVTLHNIPEGAAVGVSLAGSLLGTISIASSLILSLGIAIQNIPEGSIISMPLKIKGNSKIKSFFYGFLSGAIEPIFSLITIILLNIITPLLPYLLSFASGAMLHVIFDELTPQIHEDNKSTYGIIGIVIGFIIMMILDIALS